MNTSTLLKMAWYCIILANAITGALSELICAHEDRHIRLPCDVQITNTNEIVWHIMMNGTFKGTIAMHNKKTKYSYANLGYHIDEYDGSLLISKPTKGHSFTCVKTSNNGLQETTQKTLLIIDKLTDKSVIHHKLGGTISLSCNVKPSSASSLFWQAFSENGFEGVVAFWTKEGIYSQRGYRISTIDGTLTVMNITRRLTFICKLDTKIKNQVDVKVVESYTIIHGYVGRTASLTCNLAMPEHEVIYWYRTFNNNECNLAVHINNNINDKYLMDASVTLHIQNASLTDESVYRCQIGHLSQRIYFQVLDAKSGQLQINVQTQGKYPTSHLQLMKGSRFISISADTLSFRPPAKLQWFQNNMPITQNNNTSDIKINYQVIKQHKNGYGDTHSVLHKRLTDNEENISISLVATGPDEHIWKHWQINMATKDMVVISSPESTTQSTSTCTAPTNTSVNCTREVLTASFVTFIVTVFICIIYTFIQSKRHTYRRVQDN